MIFIQVGVIVTSEQAFFANIQESTSSRDSSKEFLISTRGPSSSLSRLITEVGSFPKRFKTIHIDHTPLMHCTLTVLCKQTH